MEWFTKAADFIQSGVPGGGSNRSNGSSSPWPNLAGSLPQSDAEVAKTHNNRGTVCAAQGNHDQALENYFKSLDISLKVRGNVENVKLG